MALDGASLTLDIVKFIVIFLSLPYQVYILLKIIKITETLHLRGYIISYSILNIARTAVYYYMNTFDLAAYIVPAEVQETNQVWTISAVVYMYLMFLDCILFIIVSIINTYQSCRWLEIVIKKTNYALLSILIVLAPFSMFMWILIEAVPKKSDIQQVIEGITNITLYLFTIVSVFIPIKCYYQIKRGVNPSTLSPAVKKSYVVMTRTLLGKAIVALYQPVLITVADLTVDVQEQLTQTSFFIKIVFCLYLLMPLLTTFVTHYSMRHFFARITRIANNERSTSQATETVGTSTSNSWYSCINSLFMKPNNNNKNSIPRSNSISTRQRTLETVI